MPDFKKIEYYDLRAEALRGVLPAVIGRTEELSRLTRIMRRRLNTNCIIVGASGVGKTTLVRGWVESICRDPEYKERQFIQLDTEHLHEMSDTDAPFVRYQEALTTLPQSTLFIDDFGKVVYNNASLLQRFIRLYAPIIKKSTVQLVLTMQPQEFNWLSQEHPAFLNSFEVITLKNQTAAEYSEMLQVALLKLDPAHEFSVPPSVIEEMVGYIERFPKLGSLPRAGISLLDESLASLIAQGVTVITDEIIQSIVSAKTGVPITSLKHNEMEALRHLEKTLNERVIGQEGALKKIASAIQRATLGMRNPHKPRGSFLMLGPSGVGKTETAKLVAEKIFGHTESFIRFDMSEFAQEHTVQRLIGAPAGYIGHESGGALTNALKEQPHSLILLDEIEKAHPKVFDIFLQVLDDGRLTSGQNETVDARHAIIMMTSNIAVPDILAGINAGEDVNSESFISERLMPALSSVFRLEFINRFDHILAFNALTEEALFNIAKLELKKIEKRLAKHQVQFNIEPETLKERIKTLSDPRFGARPIKRFIEETCESLLVDSLLAEPNLEHQ